MGIVLGIGGLGDWITSLLPWKLKLQQTTQGVWYKFVDVEVTGKTGFSHRVLTLEHALKETHGKVLIIGQSAGALAALVVASRYPKKVSGVIAVSPAMPRGISPLGLPLLKIMWRYQIAMWRSELIKVSAKDYTKLALNGVTVYKNFLLDCRQFISGREATELSTPWLQPKLGNIEVPVVYVYGDQDQWVSPRAHIQFASRLQRANPTNTSIIKVEGAGHLPAHSKRKNAVCIKAFEAMAKLKS